MKRNIYRQMQLNKAGTPAAHMSGGGISFMENGIRLMLICKFAGAGLLFLLEKQKKK